MKQFLLLISLLLPLTSAANTLKIAIGEYPPYSEKPPSSQSFVPAIIRAAFRTQGYHVEFDYLPWGRNFVEAQKGRYDATAFWFCNDSRRVEFLCSHALYQETTYFFYNTDKPIPDWRSLEDLDGKLIGVTTGYSYTPELYLEAKRKTFQLDWARTDKQNLERLIKGHIDAFPMSLIPANHLLENSFSEQQRIKLSYKTKPLLTASNHLLFLKSDPNSNQRLVIFNKGLEQIRQNGIYDAIMSNALGSNRRLAPKDSQ